MKNTSQVRSNHPTNPVAPQAPKPANPGQNGAKLSPAELDRIDAYELLQSVVRQTKAFQILLFNSINAENVDLWVKDSGYLAAGLQDIMWQMHEAMDLAEDAVKKVI